MVQMASMRFTLGLMYTPELPLRTNLTEAHEASWQAIGEPGAFWTGPERVQMVAHARAATNCKLCEQRKAALSPFAVPGEHDEISRESELPPALIDAIHRIRSDPGRLTRSVFAQVIAAGVSEAAYVEMVSVINSSVIIDTLHRSLGLSLPELPEAREGEVSGDYNTEAVDRGAWVPVLDADQDLFEPGMPRVPNILRSMGLVPSAVQLFFQTFRPHYALANIPLSISQAQAEFVAARVSALNECFY